MPNQGTLELTLLTTAVQPAGDPSTFVSFQRVADGQEIKSARTSFPPARRFKLPAFPQERTISCFISPKRYRHRQVGMFTLTDGETIFREPTVFRLPHLWAARFVKWTDLGEPFRTLRNVLDESPDVNVKGGKRLGRFVAEVYDGVSAGDRVTVNAKACLLNLFAKLNTVKEPTLNRKSWFGFVERVLEIGRERMIAVVDGEMLKRVRQVHDAIDQFPDYKRTPVGDHHKNIPPGFTFTKSSMVSVKTKEDNGNLQLTLTPAVDSAGANVTLMDADIDENGKLMAHLTDLFKHTFNGGTHPFDIHEYLQLEDKNRRLGYDLI
jgi:hypothetical protein